MGARGADDRGGLKRRDSLFSIVGVARGALDIVDRAVAWGSGGGRRRNVGHLGVGRGVHCGGGWIVWWWIGGI
ncbi:hypothetical protein ACFX14_022656 [Malus domestica]